MHVSKLQRKKRHLAYRAWNIKVVDTQEGLGYYWLTKDQLKYSLHEALALPLLLLGMDF